jgi:hypothetical protein
VFLFFYFSFVVKLWAVSLMEIDGGDPLGQKKRFGPAGRQLVQDITKLSFSASFLVIYWDFEFSQMQSPISYMISKFFLLPWC